MSDVNRWTATGRLTRDPEKVGTNGESAICKMRIAVSQAGKNGQAGYFDVKCFAGQATACLENLSKGRQVGIDGRLHFDEFETRDGAYASRVSVYADRVHFLDRPSRSEEAPREESPEEPAGVAGEADGRS